VSTLLWYLTGLVLGFSGGRLYALRFLVESQLRNLELEREAILKMLAELHELRKAARPRVNE